MQLDDGSYKDLGDCHGEAMPVPKVPDEGRDESIHDEEYEDPP